MRQRLGLLLRLVIAAVGIVYVAMSVDWVDSVTLPAEYTPHIEQSVRVGVDDVRGKTLILEAGSPVERVPSERYRTAGMKTQPGEAQLKRLATFHPSVFRKLRGADLRLLLMGLLAVGLIFPAQTLRWHLLLRARGMPVRLWRTFRLTVVGHFFNFCFPMGMTGGDVMKAYYAAKGSGRRADAVMSVIFDRIAGLLGLVLLAGIAGLFMLDRPVVRNITLLVWGGLALLVVLSTLYFSKRARATLRVGRLLAWLPFQEALKSVDQAARAYRDHKWAVLGSVAMSVPVHAVLAWSVAQAGRAVGLEAPLGVMLTVLPVVFLAGSLPISPQGVGVMEWLGIQLLTPSGASQSGVVLMLLLFRLYLLFWAVMGAAGLLGGDIHLHADAQDAEPDHVGPVPVT
jgi:uncharacterized protein (TIRG00374 family)